MPVGTARHLSKTVLRCACIGAAALLAGCSFVAVQNVSEATAVVRVIVPDNGYGYTRKVRSGDMVEVFTGHGGRYTVTVLPDEDYRNLLTGLRAEISRRLFRERDALSADDVRNLVQRLRDVDEALADLARPGASCGGTVSDFESVVATVSYDAANGRFSVSCG